MKEGAKDDALALQKIAVDVTHHRLRDWLDRRQLYRKEYLRHGCPMLIFSVLVFFGRGPMPELPEAGLSFEARAQGA